MASVRAWSLVTVKTNIDEEEPRSSILWSSLESVFVHLRHQPWLCWRRIHTGLTYWLKLPHSTFKEVAQHYSTSAFFKRIVFLKSECINVWLSVNWICQRQVCLVFYFCGKFELSFFNILSLKVIGVVLPPPAGRRTWCLSHQQSTSSAFIVFQLHPNTRKCQTVSTTTYLLFIL